MIQSSPTDIWLNFENSFLSPLAKHRYKFSSVQEAIGDLQQSGRKIESEYVRFINSEFGDLLKMKNHPDETNRLISNQDRVRRRFRIYQILASKGVDGVVRREVYKVIAGKQDVLSNEAWNQLKSKRFLMYDDSFKIFRTKELLTEYLMDHQTKKQTQRALVCDQPAPAALSIPDDACHYGELRTLSAREMARIQSFPDGFKFRSKMTTGGSSRKFEVPIYTQIGNTVPVVLGLALGKAMKNILSRLNA